MQLERGEVGNGTVTSMKESVSFVKQASSLYMCNILQKLDRKLPAACRKEGKSSCV